MKSFIHGYNEGADISLFNTIYHKSKKDPETGKYGEDSLDIIYYDNLTNEKKVEHIKNPKPVAMWGHNCIYPLKLIFSIP